MVDSYEGTSNLVSWTPSIGLAQTEVFVRVIMGSDSHRSEASDTLNFTTPNVYIETPTLTVEGTPSDIAEQPTLTGSAFSVYNGTDTHVSTDWSIEENGTVIWSSIGNTSDKLSITVPAGYLVESTTYDFKVVYNGATYGSSSATTVSGTTKDAFFSYDSSMGQPLEGGFYVGKITRSDGDYALIISPKASGEASTTLQWRNTQSSTGGCKSLNNGAENTATMVSLGNSSTFPAAHFCNNLTIGGHSDWYLPARDELELAYRNLKPTSESNRTDNRSKSSYVYTDNDDVSADTMGVNRHSNPTGPAYTSSNPVQTTVAAFKTGGAEALSESPYGTNNLHWSSTEYSSAFAWNQYLADSFAGYQSYNYMDTSISVRAFRAIKL